MPGNRVQFSEEPQIHSIPRREASDMATELADAPASAAVRQAATTMLDDVYAAVMLEAGADDNTLSMALCRTLTEFNARKAQLMRRRLDEMVHRKKESDNQRKNQEKADEAAREAVTPPTKKYLRRKKNSPHATSPSSDSISLPPHSPPPLPCETAASTVSPPDRRASEPSGVGDAALEDPMLQIKKHKRDLERLRKKRAAQESRKLQEWQEEIKANELRAADRQYAQKQARKEELQLKRQARLDRAAIKEKELEAIRRDQSCGKYGREQQLRAKRRNDDYAKRVEMPELENRKKILADLRQQFDPMDHMALRRREKEYMQEMSADRVAGKEQRKIELELNQLTAARHHKGEYQERIKLEMKEKKQMHLKEKADKQERIERRYRYAELAQEMFKPNVDEDLAQQVANRAQQPCAGWGWNQVKPKHQAQPQQAPKTSRTHYNNLQRQPSDVSVPDSSAHRPATSRLSSRQEEEGHSPRGQTGEGVVPQLEFEEQRRVSVVSQHSAELFSSRRSTLQDSDALSVGAAPSSRMSEYSSRSNRQLPEEANVQHNQHADGSTAVLAGGIEAMIHGEGQQLVRLSSAQDKEATGESNLEALQQGLAAQSMASAEYLKAIQSNLEAMESDVAPPPSVAPPSPQAVMPDHSPIIIQEPPVAAVQAQHDEPIIQQQAPSQIIENQES